MIQTLIAKLWPAIPGALLAFVLSWWLHGAAVDRINAAHAKELQAQHDQLISDCQKQKAITEGVANEYQKQILALRTQRHALRVQHPAACVPIIKPARPAGGDHAAAQPHKLT